MKNKSKRFYNDELWKGFKIDIARVRIVNDWKAAYGLELIRITKEADELQDIMGVYVEPYYPTEEEFLEARQMAKKGNLGSRTPTLHSLGIPSLLRRG